MPDKPFREGDQPFGGAFGPLEDLVGRLVAGLEQGLGQDLGQDGRGPAASPGSPRTGPRRRVATPTLHALPGGEAASS